MHIGTATAENRSCRTATLLVTTNHQETLRLWQDSSETWLFQNKSPSGTMVVTKQIPRKTWLFQDRFIGKLGCYETDSSENMFVPRQIHRKTWLLRTRFIGQLGCYETDSSENMFVPKQIHRKTWLFRNRFIGKHWCYKTNSSENHLAHFLILQPPFLRKFIGIHRETQHSFQQWFIGNGIPQPKVCFWGIPMDFLRKHICYPGVSSETNI